MKRISACIFDLDGVIVDTAHYHFLAWRRLANELGFDLNETQNERLKGVSRMRSLEIVLEIGNIRLADEKREELANRKNEWFLEYVEQMSPEEVFPGVRELIEDMRKEGIRIALASSSKNASRVVELLQVRELFEAIVDGTMITHSKPHPEIFLLAARKLHVDPSQCLVFEDAEAGVVAAHAAGMRCVGVGSSDVLGKADLVVAATGDFKLPALQQFETV